MAMSKCRSVGHFPEVRDLSFFICHISHVIFSLVMNAEREVTAHAMKERLIDFAVRIVKLADALPQTLPGKHMARTTTLFRNFTGAQRRPSSWRRKQCRFHRQTEDSAQGTQ
jgi:hypothetical protein